MRTLLTGERAVIAGARVVHSLRVEVQDVDGTWQDWSDYVIGATWGETLDQPVSQATVRVRRADGDTNSLAPTRSDSPLNVNAALTYAPALDVARLVRISTATSAPGASPSFREMWLGRIDDIDWAADPIVLACSDLGAFLMDTQIETTLAYWSTDGVVASSGANIPEGTVAVAVEAVMQRILDDSPSGIISPTIYTPDSPGWMINPFTQTKVKAFEGAVALSQQIGWDFRYRYDASHVARLTFMDPARDRTDVDATIGPAEYSDVRKLQIALANVRNAGFVSFTDASGALGETSASDPDSIAKFGRRYMELEAGANIDTLGEAETYLASAIHDLSGAPAEQEVESLYLWFVQLFDRYVFLANGDHYNTDQTLSVTGYQHTFEGGRGMTTLTCAGRVVGGSAHWLQKTTSGTNTPDPRILFQNFRIIAKTATAITYAWDATPNAETVWTWDRTRLEPVTAEPWPPLDDEGYVTEVPDGTLSAGAGVLEVAYPPLGSVRFIELLGIGRGSLAGDPVRIVLYPHGTPPSFGEISQVTGESGLFAALRIVVNDPANLGGTLRAWLNHDDPFSADPSAAPDGAIAIASTPHTVTPADAWVTGSGSVDLLANIAVHPGRGKRVFFEFTNSAGVSSGQQSFQILSEGGIIDEHGHLLPGAVADALAYAIAQPAPSVGPTFPSSPAVNDTHFLTATVTTHPERKLYKWNGAAWIRLATADGADIIANTILVGALTAGSVTSTAIAAAAVQAVHLAIAVLADISDDLGIIVAGKLTSISGAITLDLNATGTSRVFNSPNFYILANGDAAFTGTVAASLFTAMAAYFSGMLSVGGGYLPSGSTLIEINEGAVLPAIGLAFTHTIDALAVAYATGHALRTNSSLILGGDLAAALADVATLKLAGANVSLGVADSGGTGYRALVVPN